MANMADLEVYTDGGCSGNPGPGAWAYLICSVKGCVNGSGSEKSTTNNRMELLAVIKALEAIESEYGLSVSSLKLYTDSEYVKKGITEWIKKWETNGFRTSSGKPVKNQDLWIMLKERASGRPLSWHWVAGHSGNPRNEECDRLVQKEIARLKKS